jgi:Protein of unknown function (DUF1573)
MDALMSRCDTSALRTVKPNVVILALLSLTFILGCNDQVSSPESYRTVRDQTSNAAENDRSGQKLITHDFGVLRPAQSVTHTYVIDNDGTTNWTIAAIDRTCLCTVVNADKQMARPGEQFNLTVAYRSPDKNVNDVRRLQVRFQEPNAPKVDLIVKAMTREPLSLSPAVLRFPKIGRGVNVDAFVELENFGDEEFEHISVTSSAPWLSVSHVSATPIGEHPPRQSWRLVLKAATTDLQSGTHEASVSVSLLPSSPPLATLPVELVVASPIEAVPSRLFLGEIDPNVPVKFSVLLHFAAGSAPSNESDLHLTHNLGPELTLQCTSQGTLGWVITGDYRPAIAKTDRSVSGMLTVAFSNSKLPKLTIPVDALVKQR